MRLRNWQAECVTKAVGHFREGNSNFLLVSPPGTEKSVTVAEIGACLHEEELVDLILCLSPSGEIRDGLYRTFNQRMPDSFHKGFGSVGESITYQRLLTLDDSFLAAAKNKRILVICDEIHHCSGGGDSIANAWGSKMLNQILELATYTLCLSGTPWRTDQLPIALAKYSQDDELVVNYQYSLLQAVSEGVCRQPVICLIDNDDCCVDEQNYGSIDDALIKTDLMYRQILENEPAIKHLLQLSISKLHEIRAHTPDAAGLVVAHSIEHAHRIKLMLEQTFNQTALLVSYREKNPQAIIEQFRHGNTQWIVSIGMISEGTDIPRLHVCCHITTIRTELYFRQVLGRVLRVRAADNSSEGFLFTFAEPQLKSFACRVQNELPLLDVLRKSKPPCKPGQGVDEKSLPSGPTNIPNESSLKMGERANRPTVSGTPKEKPDLRWSFKGGFREEIIRALSQI